VRGRTASHPHRDVSFDVRAVVTPYYQDDLVTIYHGDCREVLPDLSDRADLVLTDPPYSITQLGRYEEPGGVAGTTDAFWVLPAMRLVARTMAADSFMVSFYGWRQADDFLVAWRACGLRPVGHLVWIKRQWGLGKYVRAKHESAYLLTRGAPKPRAVVADVFDWQREPVKEHPAQKPVGALAPVIDALCSSLVLDPFMGTGATLVAAQQVGRRAVGIEIEERYCEIAARRCSQEVLGLSA
jgi:adenine-specific DNA-methyltransferase